MRLHGNARLIPHGRTLMCRRVREDGWTVAEAAEAAGCSQRTCYRWLARYDAGQPMMDRSSAPRSVPGRTAPEVEALIEQLRRLRWSSTRIAAELGLATSTVCTVLTRQGLHRLSRLEPPEPPNRYCRRHPGELIHIDIKKLGRFDRPGLPGHLRQAGYQRHRAGKQGWDYGHVAVDDTSRLAYVEILDDETGPTCVAFLRRTIAWFASHDVRVQRVMTDNGTGYRSKAHAAATAELGIRHLRTRPYRPRTNGKPNASSRPSRSNGPTPSATRTTGTDGARCSPGSSTTTIDAHTAPSATRRPPVASPTIDQRSWDLHLAQSDANAWRAWSATRWISDSWGVSPRETMATCRLGPCASNSAICSAVTGCTT
jgi:transposase